VEVRFHVLLTPKQTKIDYSPSWLIVNRFAARKTAQAAISLHNWLLGRAADVDMSVRQGATASAGN
jgi:hypothetical protein